MPLDPFTVNLADRDAERYAQIGITLDPATGAVNVAATVALAARYDAIVSVVLGTTLGMMLANAPVVLLGDKVTKKVPIRVIHVIAAAIFAVLGVVALVSG